MAKWFENVGHHQESSLEDWEDWPGPEDPECEAVGTLGQQLLDALSAQCGLTYDTFMGKVKQVLADISRVHTWDEDSDSYDPRSTAAWEAAWWVSLRHYYQEHQVETPQIVKKMIDIFDAGYWPYGIKEDGSILIY